MNLRVSTGCYILSSYFIFFTGGFNQPKDSHHRVPDVDGNIDLPKSNPKILHRNTRSEGIGVSVQFFLSESRNFMAPIKLEMKDPKLLKNSTFNTNGAIFVTHGSSKLLGRESITSLIRQAYVDRPGTFNVIEVIWSPARNEPPHGDSETAMAVGTLIARMIDYLISNAGLKLEKTYLIGHSLGAHIMGVAGRELNSGMVDQIYGLDPGPLRSGSWYSKGRLTKSSGKYVQVIHTNGNRFGLLEPLGHVDFYPNGGLNQPGCDSKNAPQFVKDICSHERAAWYFIESVYNVVDFQGFKCTAKENPYKGPCSGNSQVMGVFLRSNPVPGIYYLKTQKTAPYALGAVIWKSSSNLS